MCVREREKATRGNFIPRYTNRREGESGWEEVARFRLREAIARSRGNVNSRNNLITDRLDLKVEAKLRPLNVSTRFRRVNS